MDYGQLLNQLDETAGAGKTGLSQMLLLSGGLNQDNLNTRLTGVDRLEKQRQEETDWRRTQVIADDLAQRKSAYMQALKENPDLSPVDAMKLRLKFFPEDAVKHGAGIASLLNIPARQKYWEAQANNLGANNDLKRKLYEEQIATAKARRASYDRYGKGLKGMSGSAVSSGLDSKTWKMRLQQAKGLVGKTLAMVYPPVSEDGIKNPMFDIMSDYYGTLLAQLDPAKWPEFLQQLPNDFKTKLEDIGDKKKNGNKSGTADSNKQSLLDMLRILMFTGGGPQSWPDTDYSNDNVYTGEPTNFHFNTLVTSGANTPQVLNSLEDRTLSGLANLLRR